MTELDPSAAGRSLGEHRGCLPIESWPVAHCAGAGLRENVYAERDQPPFDRVSMDGIAIASARVASTRRFRVQGTQAAGEPPPALRAGENCIAILTGAVLPAGAHGLVHVSRMRINNAVAQVGRAALPTPRTN